MGKNSEYRHSPERCIFVQGEINQGLVDKLTPEILHLRSRDNTPITVYIDSPGGGVAEAQAIRSLLQGRNQDGKAGKIITVVTNLAGSAAADFLSLGDYAIALQNTKVHFHGTRETQDSITFEDAIVLSRHLSLTNEEFAIRLARKMYPRLLFRLAQFDAPKGKYLIDLDLEQFVHYTIRNFVSKQNKALVDEAIRKEARLKKIAQIVNGPMRKLKPSFLKSRLKVETVLLNSIIKYKQREHKADGWLLTDGGLEEIKGEFDLISEYYFSHKTKMFSAYSKDYIKSFLTDEEQSTVSNSASDSETEDSDDPEVLLERKAKARLAPIWYFAVSFCRLLQTRENIFNSNEAFVLGLVDENGGGFFPGPKSRRQVSESSSRQVES